MVTTLETQRLVLRKFNESDLDDFFLYAKSPNVGPNAGWKPHETKEESLKILNDFINGDEEWAIIYKENNNLIGGIGLHNDSMRTAPNTKKLGYVLSEDYWGKGLMTEAVKSVMSYAFEELKLNLLSIEHYPFNIRSRRVIEKSGFKYEGILRYAKQVYDGAIYDVLCYSITKDEWKDI